MKVNVKVNSVSVNRGRIVVIAALLMEWLEL